MKGHRFYEILEAHKKGEDLSVFVPTNPAEADLLADLSGGTGGSTGGASMVPTYFEYNNPNIGNMYYGMVIPTWNKVKINVAKVFDAYAKKYLNSTFRQVFDNGQLNDLIQAMNNNGIPMLFQALILEYYFDPQYGDSFDGADTGNRVGISFNPYEDDGTYKIEITFQQGMGYFPKSYVNIDANGNFDVEEIEYDLTGIRVDNQSSGPEEPHVLVIYNIMELINLNILEKFDLFSFE